MSIQKQYDYNDAYQKENIQRVVVKFNKKNERDQKILDHLYKVKQESDKEKDPDKKTSIQSYIKDVIEADMNK